MDKFFPGKRIFVVWFHLSCMYPFRNNFFNLSLRIMILTAFSQANIAITSFLVFEVGAFPLIYILGIACATGIAETHQRVRGQNFAFLLGMPLFV